jgi:hypothetical protein
LTKAYGEHVGKDANIVIERGEKVAFVGKMEKEVDHD